VKATHQDYLISGTSLSHRAEVERLLQRDDQGKTALVVNGAIKDVWTFVDGTFIEGASRRLVSIGGEISHARRLLGGSGAVGLGFEQGLAALGARRDGDDLADDEPRAQYTKLTADLSFQRSVSLAPGIAPYLSTQVMGQWSPHTLFSTERITIGGQYSVRGLDENTFSGDIGGTIRNEVGLPIPMTDGGWIGDVLGTPVLFGGLDAGWLYPDDEDAYERGTAMGVAGGVRLEGGILTGEASVEQALFLPDTVEPEGPVFRFRLGLRW
jgi:hemolysin activation/secretion protein